MTMPHMDPRTMCIASECLCRATTSRILEIGPMRVRLAWCDAHASGYDANIRDATVLRFVVSKKADEAVKE